MPVQDAKLLSGILAQGRIAIPEYQREYEWEFPLVKSLWEDLETCINEDGNSADYFLGNIMLHDRKDGMSTVWDLVDGQQRLVTITLLSAVVRDKLIEMGQHAEAHELQEAILWKKGMEDPYLLPRLKTKNLLRPAQLPLNQKISFRFKESIDEIPSTPDKFELAEEVIAKFLIPANIPLELAPGIHFTPMADILPGQSLEALFGKLSSPDAINKKQKFTLESEDCQEKAISALFGGKWPNEGLRRHYKTNIPGLFKSRYENQSNKYITADLLIWRKLLMDMKFTLTIFPNDDDAIYYFGKLNESDSKLQLNPGDLMRHFVITTSKLKPVNAVFDQQIRDEWDAIEASLKIEGKMNTIPSFLRNWLIATGRRTTEKKSYKKMKELCTNSFKSVDTNLWKKKEFYEFLQEMRKSSQEFAEIVFPENTPEGANRMLFDVLNRNYKQHTSFLLAGSMSFLRQNQTNYFKRLIRIFEYLVIKGVLLPKMAGDEVMSIASNDVYTWADKFCSEIYQHSNHYKTKIPPTQVEKSLDYLATKVKSACSAIWSGDLEWDENTLPFIKEVYEYETTQNEAKLLLTILELNEAGASKTWSPNVQVEHIAPKTWNQEYNDPKKGGGFNLEVDSEGFLVGKSKELYKKYKDRIGNKTLLNADTNNNLDNICFTLKKEHHEHGYSAQSATWKITEQLLHYDVWGPSQIDERTKKMIKQIVKIFDESYVN